MAGEIDIIDTWEVCTIPALFGERVQRSGNRVAYRQYDREGARWEDWTWSEIARLVARWRAGLKAENLAFGARVAILRWNSVEWVCCDQAALSLGLVVVPLHASDSPHNQADALAETEARLLLVDDPAQWSALVPFRTRFPNLETIISVSPPRACEPGVKALGEWLPDAEAAADPSVLPGTLASITYTSGTTGRPKGVMLSHANLIFATNAALRRIVGRTDDVLLSFLPLAHILERIVGYYAAIASGAQVGFARSVHDLPEDLRTVRPTILVAVPRIYERAWQKVEDGLATILLNRRLAEWVLRRVADEHPFGNVSLMRLFARLLAPRLQAEFGGGIRIAISGAAPLPIRICRGLRAAGLPLTEGYGLTEATGPVTAEVPERATPGSVGRPLDGVDLRISADGEILIRSPGIMTGYWRRPKDTADAIDADGWLHTGDLGEKSIGGDVFILGRSRDTIIMSTGEKVSPMELEGLIASDPLFDHVVVLGSGRPFLVALVVLNEAQWRAFADAHGRDSRALADEATERLLLDRVAQRTTNLPRHAQIRRLRPTSVAWTVANGLISVTLKPKREALGLHFAAEIEELYRPHGAVARRY